MKSRKFKVDLSGKYMMIAEDRFELVRPGKWVWQAWSKRAFNFEAFYI